MTAKSPPPLGGSHYYGGVNGYPHHANGGAFAYSQTHQPLADIWGGGVVTPPARNSAPSMTSAASRHFPVIDTGRRGAVTHASSAVSIPAPVGVSAGAGTSAGGVAGPSYSMPSSPTTGSSVPSPSGTSPFFPGPTSRSHSLFAGTSSSIWGPSYNQQRAQTPIAETFYDSPFQPFMARGTAGSTGTASQAASSPATTAGGPPTPAGGPSPPMGLPSSPVAQAGLGITAPTPPRALYKAPPSAAGPGILGGPTVAGGAQPVTPSQAPQAQAQAQSHGAHHGVHGGAHAHSSHPNGRSDGPKNVNGRRDTLSPSPTASNSSGNGSGGNGSRKKGKPSTNTELYKTELCASYMSTGGNCPYGDKCQFAHGEAELKAVDRPPKWRSKPCQNWVKYGNCSYNDRCCFRHDTPAPAQAS